MSLAFAPVTTAHPAPGVAAASPPPTNVTVMMHDFAFVAPDGTNTVTVVPGTTVTWTWNESSSDTNPNCDTPALQGPSPLPNCPGHTSTSYDKGPGGTPLWDSGTCKAPDGAGCPWSRVFNSPGTYDYYCVYHGGANPNNPYTHMDGVVVVSLPKSSTPKPTASASASAAPASSPAPAATAAPAPPARLPNTGLPASWGAFAVGLLTLLGAGRVAWMRTRTG